MKRKVVTAPDAVDALRRARRWLRQPGLGVEGARRWITLRDIRRALRTHPYLGAESPEIADHRCISVFGYRLIYRVDPDTGDERTAGGIRVVAVFGPGQQ